MDSIKEKVITAYRDGSDLGYISTSLKISKDEIKNILINLKESNRFKRTFTDEFKRIISERDKNGVSRRQISLELEMNASTVKKACEQFGNSIKEKSLPYNEFTKIKGKFDKAKCPNCESRSVNNVGDNEIYCLNCGNEYIFKKDHIFRVNWEYLD